MLYIDISQWEHTVRGAQYDKAIWCWRKLSIVRTRYTIAKPICAPFLDPNKEVLFSGSIMYVRACTNLQTLDPPSVLPTSS